MPTGRLLGRLLCLLLVVGCVERGTPTPSPWSPDPSGSASPAGAVRVTLGLYSGRPDPSWILTDREVAALDAALAALPPVVGDPPVGGLGYHGFTVDRPGTSPEVLVVAYRGAVASPGTGPRSILLDPGRTIERLLLETARAHAAVNELAEVERALAAP